MIKTRGSFLLCMAWLLWLSLHAVMAEEDGGEPTHDGGGEPHGEEIEPVTEVLFPWFANILGVICFYLLARYCHMLPYTAVMFILGLCMGVGYARLGGDSQLHDSLALWESIDGELLLLTFLPGLLFKDAFCSNVHLMALAFNQCLTMAFPMVLAGTCLTALVAFYIFPYGWSWNLSMTIGAILSATDPVAVSSLLEEVGAPPRLKVHISGESLLNDGSAMVFYTIFSELFLYELNIGLGQDIDGGEGVKIFCRMAFGGFGIGVAFGLALCFILFLLNRNLNMEENVVQIVATITMAYLSFYVADPVSHTSGVIAVVFCGFTTKAFGMDMINDLHMMENFWVLVEHILNTILFALGGLVFGTIIANTDERYGFWTGRDWGFLFVLYILLTAIRFFLFFSFYPINSRLGLGSNWKECFFQSYGGLRGAVGIALAILLDDQVFSNTQDQLYRSYTTKVFGMVGGIAFLTLTINGTLAGPLLKKLGLAEDTEMRHRIVAKYEKAYKDRVLVDFVHLLMDPIYQRTDYAIVRNHIPDFTDVTEAQFRAAVAQNKARTPANLYRTPYVDNVLKTLEASGGEKETGDDTKDDAKETTGDGKEGEDTVEKPIEEETAAKDDDVIPSNLLTSSMASSPEEEVQLAIEFRKIFVELLRSAYHKLIEFGELDGREGFATYALLEGLEFTNDAVQNGKPLDDWEMVVMVCNSWTEPADRYLTRMFRNLSSCCGSNKKRRQVIHDAKQVNPEHEKVIGIVRMAIGFTRAHEIAEELFKKEMECMGAPKTEALILEESQAQVKLAKEAFDFQGDTVVSVSHLVSCILLNKAARYVERLCKNGLLKEGEASEFLEDIQEKLLKVYACPVGAHEADE